MYWLGKTTDLGSDPSICKLIEYLRKKHPIFAYTFHICERGCFFAKKSENTYGVNCIVGNDDWSMLVWRMDL